MPAYEFRCQNCGVRLIRYIDLAGDDERTAWNRGTQPCPDCSHGHMKRVWGFRQAPMMHEHWNASVGKPISSMKQFKDELRRASDEKTERTGIVHDFVPVDPKEMSAGDAGKREQYDRAVLDGRIEASKKIL
jgi:hypothetical protein